MLNYSIKETVFPKNCFSLVIAPDSLPIMRFKSTIFFKKSVFKTCYNSNLALIIDTFLPHFRDFVPKKSISCISDAKEMLFKILFK